MANTILIKKSSTANAVPQTSDLAFGELAINITDGNLFYKNSATGNVTVIASNKLSSVSGNVTGGNVLTAGQVSATGNVIGGNLVTGGMVTAAGTIVGSTLETTGSGGDITLSGGNILGANNISLTSNVVAGNMIASMITATGKIGRAHV